jgi:hypothetical protein
MELQIKPHATNPYPLGGIFIRGSRMEIWLQEIQEMGLSLSKLAVYPLPGSVPNTIAGCLVELTPFPTGLSTGKNQTFQLLHGLLFIPEKSAPYPHLGAHEIDKLFSQQKHFYLPELGYIPLEEPIQWETYISVPPVVQPVVTIPAPTLNPPAHIRSFQVIPLSPEKMIQQLEEKSFPKKQKLPDEPLNTFERGKLFFYRNLFKKEKEGVEDKKGKPDKSPLMKGIESIGRIFSKKGNSIGERWEQDFENLEKRNQNELDRLLDLFKTNPAEALKYAIPIDNTGTNRGGDGGSFSLTKRWFDFSLFGSDNNHGSGSVNFGDSGLHRLQQQYRKTAAELIQRGDYLNAAFVYLKLLKDPHRAAQILEEGKLYQEAATLYLKQCNSPVKAAECYEKGNMTQEAIQLYKEAQHHEKVGDLYMQLQKTKEAFTFYELVADDYKKRNQYVKASLLYKNKMNNPEACQDTLLQGWRSHYDASNCLNNYFNNIQDTQQLGHAIRQVYAKDVSPVNEESFLHVIKHEYNKKNELAAEIKHIAYEIIVQRAKTKPAIISELRSFNHQDKELFKDTLRYKVNQTGKS